MWVFIMQAVSAGYIQTGRCRRWSLATVSGIVAMLIMAPAAGRIGAQQGSQASESVQSPQLLAELQSGRPQGASIAAGTQPTAVAPFSKPGLVLGTHYWGNGWPMNFWNALERGRVREDFRRIREDGFNTVILAVPWNEFSDSERPGVLKRRSAELLGYLLNEAAAANLRVGLRVSYLWDFSEAAVACDARIAGLFEDPSRLSQWGDYVAAIYKEVGAHPAFAFAFITWEDFFLTRHYMDGSEARRLTIAKKSGFQRYVRGRYSLAALHALYGREFERYEDVPLPQAGSTASVLYYDFWDNWLVGSVFAEAARRFPGISMECRLDWDSSPSPGGKQVIFNKHERQYKLPKTDWVASYYGPHMFARNQGEFLDGETAVRLFEHAVDHVSKLSEGRAIFIDQFNFHDNSVGFSNNAKIEPTQLDAFLSRVGEPIRSKTKGYALWAWEDYVCSNLYNPSFEVGVEGWKVTGGPEAVASGADHVLSMQSGDSVSQVVREKPQWTAVSSLHLQIEPIGNEGATLRITSGGKKVDMQVEKPGKYTISLEVLPRKPLTISCIAGRATIDDVVLDAHVQHMGFRENGGEPAIAYRGIVELNRSLTDKPKEGK